MIKIQLDLAKINKNKIRVNGKYKNYDIILIETPGGKYGDWMCKEDQSKEERDAKKPDTILGNGKNIGWSSQSGTPPATNNNSSVSVEDLGI